jgi:hypothetical protein
VDRLALTKMTIYLPLHMHFVEGSNENILCSLNVERFFEAVLTKSINKTLGHILTFVTCIKSCTWLMWMNTACLCILAPLSKHRHMIVEFETEGDYTQYVHIASWRYNDQVGD